MPTATSAFQLQFTDLANTSNKVSLSETESFTQVAEEDLSFAGAGSQPLNLGTMSAADTLLIYAKSGALTLTLTGLGLKAGGVLSIGGATVTAGNIISTAGGTVKTVALG